MVVALLAGWAGSHLLGGGQRSDMVSSTDGGESVERLYTCGMHPNVLQKGPGICPICEMKLTPVRTESADGLDAQHKLTLTLAVPSAEKAYEELILRDKNIPGGLKEAPGRGLIFETHDPDGVKISFVEAPSVAF